VSKTGPDASGWDDPVGVPPGADRYASIGTIGEGGGGRVGLAYDQRLDRSVVLKSVTHGRAVVLARLRREAAILAALEHPGIVPIYDLVEHHDGAIDLALRVVRGRTLASVIASEPTLTARLRWVRTFLAAVEAVAFVHSRRFVHRDLKPTNIMVGEFGETQVIDWGLAVRRSEPGSATELEPIDISNDRDAAVSDDAWQTLDLARTPTGGDLTEVGTVIGTPRYMSPEQARGESSDRRSDVWSMGATLFELVAGRPAYLQDDRATLLAALRGGPPPKLNQVCPEAPVELAAIVDRAMAFDPSSRYGEARMRLGAHADRTGALLFDAAGEWLASGGSDGRVVFFELASLDRGVDELASEARRDWLGTRPDR